MPVAKHLSYTRSRSRTEQPRQIDGLSFTHLSNHHDEARARALRTSFEPPAITVSPVASRSIRSAAQFAETVGETIFIVAAWLLSEMLDGCAAYALAMYGIPAAINDAEAGDATASGQSDPLGHPSRPALQLISPDIRASQILSPPKSVRSEQPARGRSSLRTAFIAPAVWLLSKIRERSARRRLIADLRSMDDRSLRDIGISRTDIGHIARYGVRPE
jgi:uncharacterized protein YjiS (DUF1127 family)